MYFMDLVRRLYGIISRDNEDKRSRLEDVIYEWKKQAVRSVTIVPFTRSRYKFPPPYQFSIDDVDYYIENPADRSWADFFEEHCLHRPTSLSLKPKLALTIKPKEIKFQGSGRFYFPDVGTNHFEYEKSNRPLPELNKVVEILRKSQIEAHLKILSPLNFINAEPYGPELVVDLP